VTPRSRARRTESPAPNATRLLTTNEVAALLGVHPKHIYRLLKRGLPARRVGDEWRYDEADVLAWTREGRAPAADMDVQPVPPPPLLAANGDLAVEAFFEVCQECSGPTFGFVLSDHATGLERLTNGSILGAGCHGDMSRPVSGEKLAWLHLAERELGIAHRKGLRLRGISSILRHRLASRPSTAGIRRHFDQALQREGIALDDAYAQAEEYASHRDAVMAVVRGTADMALSSHAWAAHAGLGFTPLVAEPYGFVFRAEHLADPRVLQLCEIAQSSHYTNRVARHAGYDTHRAGLLSIGSGKSDDTSYAKSAS
jgi:putative molybdopterin biosynthesis protein